MSSKFLKNKNNADTSLYHIYLPKLYEHMCLIFNKIKPKQITIDFYHSLYMTSESPANRSDDFLV